MWLGGQQPSQADREAIEQFAEAPSPATHPNVFAWYCLCSKFNPTVRASWAGAKAAAAPKADKKKAEPKKEEAKKEVKAEDDDDDPEAEKAKMERMKEIAKTAKSYGKAPVIAKSIIVWEVKPWGEETDLKELADKIIAI